MQRFRGSSIIRHGIDQSAVRRRGAGGVQIVRTVGAGRCRTKTDAVSSADSHLQKRQVAKALERRAMCEVKRQPSSHEAMMMQAIRLHVRRQHRGGASQATKHAAVPHDTGRLDASRAQH